MSVRTYRVKGSYVKNHQKISFTHDVRAVKEKSALEYVYTVVGSQGVMRRKINIESINIVPNDQSINLMNSHIEKHVNGE